MEDPISLLDTPKRASLQSQVSCIRADLKTFERKFADDHDGQKPGKDDIKADTIIAAKYKEYNKLRDVLSGRLGIEVLDAVKSPSRHHRIKRVEIVADQTPRRRKSSKHPNDIDPYDPPSSASPKPFFLSTIGPTPQRDGRVFGLFDLMSNPGSGKSIEETPSAGKKRKRDALDTIYESKVAGIHSVVAQTPSQRSRKRSNDLLEHLSSTTPISASKIDHHRYSRTPISEGKKFMLSQFFATPSTVRYASIVHAEETDSRPQPHITPLRSRILGLSPRLDAAKLEPDATPAYLKRSFSFKEKLLSASESTDEPFRNENIDATTPTMKKTKHITSRKMKFMPKPLSQIMAEIRNLENEEHNDDLDALRELEDIEINTLAEDQPKNEEAEANDNSAARVWKKKGQKRTTRRTIIRPVKMKAAEAPKFVTANDDDFDDEEEEAAVLEVSRIEETQIGETRLDFDVSEYSEDELQEIDTTTVNRPRAPKPRVDKDGDYNEHDNRLGKPSNMKKALGLTEVKQDKTRAKETETKKTAMINPNALAHMNFRSLKIKNKNSRAKTAGRGMGRGRFGKGRSR